ncbi:MAG: hypothetical protein ACHQFX_13510 [Chitinophagales bacterium]
MIIRPAFVALVLSSSYFAGNSQTILKGKIHEAETDSVISAVNIFNLNTKQSARSAADGRYMINATEGDRIIFSIAGFKPDSITVVYWMMLTQYDVVLHKQVILLNPVKVVSSYQADSLTRRNYYSYIYEKQAGITGRNTPSSGVGIVLSPLSHFSQESRQKRLLKKRLIREEQEYYIDRCFPAEWVQSVTGLRGDSLSLFMYKYRPTYAFCRKTSREKMLIYVNDKMKDFKHSPSKYNIRH